jgi:ABC-2 type transport system permease protein
VNVYARDTQHLFEVLLLAWFWITPIVYQYRLISDKLAAHGLTWLPMLNPMTPIVLAFQRAIYGHELGAMQANGTRVALLPTDAGSMWYLRNLVLVGIGSLVMLVIAIKIFDRAEGSFAEEI